MAESNDLTDPLTDDPADAAEPSFGHIPGPSPNPATNLLIREIILRSTGRVARVALEKAMAKVMLGHGRNREIVREATANRSMLQGLTAGGMTRLATRSVPGFLLVSTGLAAKTLFDRSQDRRKARRKREQGNSDVTS